MKTYKRLFIIFCCTMILFSNLFMFYTMPVFASEGVYDPDTSWWEKFIEESTSYIAYLACRVGAIVKDFDFAKWVQTREDYKEWWNTGHISRLESSNGDVSYSFDKELMAYIKQCLDDYAKENQPFFLKSTHKANQIPANQFISNTVYNDFIKYSKEHNIFFFNFNGAGFNVTDFSPVIKEGGGFYTITGIVPEICTCIRSVDGDWNTWEQKNVYYDYHEYKRNSDGVYELAEIHKNYSYWSTNSYGIDITSGRTDFHPSYYPCCFLVTPDGGRIRVFKSLTEFMNYSVGQRKVYYTSNYYNYVPEDLTVSIDELQKTIDDMQDVIDKLLDLITDNTSESEIEELLRLILEELKNQQGGGGGSGGGGGDVNVDIDLSTTNSLLSKILAKVTQIFDKISQTVGGAADIAGTKLQETLDEILGMLKSIRRWTIADTVFDGLDAFADIASFLKDFLTAPAAAIGTAASSLGETANMLTDKFPFSIPWDMAALVTLLSAEPQAPVFKLPIVIESYGIEEYMEIDMSQFEYLSTIMRGMLSILYAYGILSMTTKVMDIGGKK